MKKIIAIVVGLIIIVVGISLVTDSSSTDKVSIGGATLAGARTLRAIDDGRELSRTTVEITEVEQVERKTQYSLESIDREITNIDQSIVNLQTRKAELVTLRGEIQVEVDKLPERITRDREVTRDLEI